MVNLTHKKPLVKTHAHMKRFIPPEPDPKCHSTVTENIDNVLNGKPLTVPLAYLNRSCDFQKVWKYCTKKDVQRGYREKRKEKNKEYAREYSRTPKQKAWQKKYHSKPEVKERMKETRRKWLEKNKGYYNSPKVKARRKAYYQKNKQKILGYMKKYYQKTKEARLKYSRNYWKRINMEDKRIRRKKG